MKRTLAILATIVLVWLAACHPSWIGAAFYWLAYIAAYLAALSILLLVGLAACIAYDNHRYRKGLAVPPTVGPQAPPPVSPARDGADPHTGRIGK